MSIFLFRVDFEKLEPKFDVIEKSQVLQVLKEDEGETVRKLSTFLQIPNRPKIKPKEKPKQSAVPPKMTEKKTEDVINQEVSENNDGEEATEDDQQNNAQDVQESQVTEREQLEETELKAEQIEENEIHSEPVEQPQSEESEKANDDTLLAIQNQLTAILQLPMVMQQQLSFIQQQLTNIVQKQVADINPASIAEDNDTKKEGMQDIGGIFRYEDNYILIRSNKMQQYAGIYLLQNYSTCLGCPLHPS